MLYPLIIVLCSTLVSGILGGNHYIDANGVIGGNDGIPNDVGSKGQSCDTSNVDKIGNGNCGVNSTGTNSVVKMNINNDKNVHKQGSTTKLSDGQLVTTFLNGSVLLTNLNGVTTKFTIGGPSIHVMLVNGIDFTLPSICVPVTSTDNIGGSTASGAGAGTGGIQEICLTPRSNAAAEAVTGSGSSATEAVTGGICLTPRSNAAAEAVTGAIGGKSFLPALCLNNASAEDKVTCEDNVQAITPEKCKIVVGKKLLTGQGGENIQVGPP